LHKSVWRPGHSWIKGEEEECKGGKGEERKGRERKEGKWEEGRGREGRGSYPPSFRFSGYTHSDTPICTSAI